MNTPSIRNTAVFSIFCKLIGGPYPANTSVILKFHWQSLNSSSAARTTDTNSQQLECWYLLQVRINWNICLQ